LLENKLKKKSKRGILGFSDQESYEISIEKTKKKIIRKEKNINYLKVRASEAQSEKLKLELKKSKLLEDKFIELKKKKSKDDLMMEYSVEGQNIGLKK
jgi:hypothetical protein